MSGVTPEEPAPYLQGQPLADTKCGKTPDVHGTKAANDMTNNLAVIPRILQRDVEAHLGGTPRLQLVCVSLQMCMLCLGHCKGIRSKTIRSGWTYPALI